MKRVFLDTGFIIAHLNSSDQNHDQATSIYPLVMNASEVITTEAIVVEIGNSFSKSDRNVALAVIRGLYETDNVRVVPVDTELLRRAIELYEQRPDKTYGLTDCISFVVMGDEDLLTAAVFDEHFEQEGFEPLRVGS